MDLVNKSKYNIILGSGSSRRKELLGMTGINFSVMSIPVDESFPDFDGVIPKDNDKNLIVDNQTLLSAVKRVSIFSNKSTHQIALNLNSEKVLVSTEDPEQSTKAKENIKGDYSGDDIVVGYNATYLKDVLSHVDDNKVVVQLKSPISAALFLPNKQKDNTNLTMLLMPIRLND